MVQRQNGYYHSSPARLESLTVLFWGYEIVDMANEVIRSLVGMVPDKGVAALTVATTTHRQWLN
jgi:hypothetical protein